MSLGQTSGRHFGVLETHLLRSLTSAVFGRDSIDLDAKSFNIGVIDFERRSLLNP